MLLADFNQPLTFETNPLQTPSRTPTARWASRAPISCRIRARPTRSPTGAMPAHADISLEVPAQPRTPGKEAAAPNPRWYVCLRTLTHGEA
jgi:hypothetical protein